MNKAGSVPMKPVELQLKAKGEINYGHLAKKWDVKIPTRSGWPDAGRPTAFPDVSLRSEPEERPGDPREHAEGESPELNDRGMGTSGPWSRSKPN